MNKRKYFLITSADFNVNYHYYISGKGTVLVKIYRNEYYAYNTTERVWQYQKHGRVLFEDKYLSERREMTHEEADTLIKHSNLIKKLCK